MAKSKPESEPKSFGRIYFPGNPWPGGHAVTAFVWTARVERGTGIWFDLHLETENYYAADEGREDDDEPETGSDWESRIVWSNYHSCTMSSTAWLGQGFLVATKHEPLDMKAVSGKEFRFDKPPVDLTPPRPFNIYLTGHDSVADHRVTFTRQRGKPAYDVDWQGRIAMTYSGDEEFRYKFRAELTGVTFDGIAFPPGTRAEDTVSLIQPFVADLHAFKANETKDGVFMVPVGGRRNAE
jgi:hypothetical protein